jgi:hypothetical protein
MNTAENVSELRDTSLTQAFAFANAADVAQIGLTS